ncbi:MAG: hypothetical protein ACE5JL_01845 [Dehalococcoidia bacterium]
MAKKSKVQAIGGREFQIVKRGLDEKQVTEFVNELMAKLKEAEEKAERPSYPSSLDKLAEQTVLEAERLAEKIENEAKQIRAQAQADAAHIRAEAQRASEEKAQSIGRLAETAADEAQRVVQNGRETAASIEAQARQQAERLLDYTKRQIESKVRRDIKWASEKLSPYVDDVIKEVQALNIELENWEVTTPPAGAPLPEATAASPEPPAAEPQEPPSSAEPSVEEETLCKGDLRVTLQEPVHLAGLGEICQRLGNLPGATLGDTRREDNGSYDITVSLGSPTPLVTILDQLEEVAEVSVEHVETPGGAVDGSEGAERQDAATSTRILLKLKD